jgi:hypothetical protein
MAAGAVAHKSARRDGESLEIPDWGEGPNDETPNWRSQ